MDSVVIISCIFGTKFNSVHPSPDKEKAFFFTNNPGLKDEIIKKGWNYIYVNKPLTDDYITSCLQAKYIKFLIFLEDFPEFKEKKTIIYTDHKILVLPNVLNEVKVLMNNNMDKSIIINQAPSCWGLKTNINHEIEAAMKQERYARNMDKTKKFIKTLVDSNEISEDVIICSTGFLIYINREKIKHLIDNIYEKCLEHQQPECQIYWGIFSQKYKKDIKIIQWEDLKNVDRWRYP